MLPLEEHYFRWLYSKVASVLEKDKSKTYWEVAKGMYSEEYIWIVPNDDNRLEDGRSLRFQFIAEEDISRDDECTESCFMEMGCSIFEMLVALVQRLSFEDGRSTRVWWLELLKNLRLDEYPDTGPPLQEDLDAIFEKLLWRTYESDGSGGLFPLKNPKQDQRVVEIWYQLSAYLNENEQ